MTQVAAFFDLDHTILSSSSGILYMRYIARRGEAHPGEMLRALGYAALYRLGYLDFPSAMARLATVMDSRSERALIETSERWFDDMVVRYVTTGARRAIAQHQAAGHHVAIVSASTRYAVGPVARYLGIDAFLCTELEVVDGRFTGRFIPPACYGEGKVYWAEKHATQHGIRLQDCYFYTDSASDLALLELVGHPVAVNPDRRLAAIAAQRGWPVQRFL